MTYDDGFRVPLTAHELRALPALRCRMCGSPAQRRITETTDSESGGDRVYVIVGGICLTRRCRHRW
jgi:hypothetical protein